MVKDSSSGIGTMVQRNGDTALGLLLALGYQLHPKRRRRSSKPAGLPRRETTPLLCRRNPNRSAQLLRSIGHNAVAS